jgi:polyisoprenyl-teichoic acid--peptidoglycan teichoic acid transferase
MKKKTVTDEISDKPRIQMPSIQFPNGTPHGPQRLKKRVRRRWPLWARVLLVIFLLLVVLSGGALAYGYYYFQTNIQNPLQKFIHPVSRGAGEPQANVSDGSVTGRSWNILLLGSDNDGKYNFPALLTQVMMVVHIDTVTNQVYMVSIPRDSWVYVPEVGGMHKIDQAFFLGATQKDSFDDGVRLARLTIEQDYGITIDRYAWVGLSGFASVINTLGGIDIDVIHPILDDSYPNDTGSGSNPNDPYALKRLNLAPGPQHLNGEQALEYVRSRHADLVGDIGRTQRQQQVLQALKKKLNAANVINNLPQLIKDMQGQVYTDLSEQELIAFANYARTLNSGDIHSLTLGPGQGSQDYGETGTAYDPAIGEEDVIFPHCQNIQPVLNSIFGFDKNSGCNVTGP